MPRARSKRSSPDSLPNVWRESGSSNSRGGRSSAVTPDGARPRKRGRSTKQAKPEPPKPAKPQLGPPRLIKSAKAERQAAAVRAEAATETSVEATEAATTETPTPPPPSAPGVETPAAGAEVTATPPAAAKAELPPTPAEVVEPAASPEPVTPAAAGEPDVAPESPPPARPTAASSAVAKPTGRFVPTHVATASRRAEASTDRAHNRRCGTPGSVRLKLDTRATDTRESTAAWRAATTAFAAGPATVVPSAPSAPSRRVPAPATHV